MMLSRRTVAVAAAIAFAIVVAVAPLGCRAVVGIEERVETCGGGLAEGTCGVCQSQRCCAYARACSERSDGAGFRGCLERCLPSDQLCPGRCANDHPEGASARAALDDCTRRQCSDSCGSWSCLGKVVWPQAPPSVTFTIIVSDSLDMHPLRGVKLAACSFANPDCGPEIARTDANGAARITLPTPRDGFVRAWGSESDTDAGAEPDTYQSLLFFSPPLSSDNAVVYTDILSLGSARQLANVIGGVDADSKGGLLVTARDCDRIHAVGVSVDLAPPSPGVTRFYVDGVLPNPTLEETTDRGVAGFGNVPPGVVTVTARSNVAQRQIGSRQVVVRAGHITSLTIPPMPERFP